MRLSSKLGTAARSHMHSLALAATSRALHAAAIWAVSTSTLGGVRTSVECMASRRLWLVTGVVGVLRGGGVAGSSTASTLPASMAAAERMCSSTVRLSCSNGNSSKGTCNTPRTNETEHRRQGRGQCNLVHLNHAEYRYTSKQSKMQHAGLVRLRQYRGHFRNSSVCNDVAGAHRISEGAVPVMTRTALHVILLHPYL